MVKEFFSLTFYDQPNIKNNNSNECLHTDFITSLSLMSFSMLYMNKLPELRIKKNKESSKMEEELKIKHTQLN